MNKIILVLVPLLIVSLHSMGYASSSSRFCARMKIESNGNQLDTLSCKPAGREWMREIEEFQDYAVPAVITTGSTIDARVLILSPKWSGAYDISSKTIINELRSRGLGVEFTLFNYQGDTQQAKIIIENAETNGIDLIISMGSATTAFLSEFYAGGNLPVVTSCSKDPVSMNLIDPTVGMSQNNIAYTSLNISVSTQVSYLKEKFLTDLHHIAVIFDRNNPSSILTQVKPLERYLANSDVDIELDMIEVDFDRIDETLYEPMQRFSDNSSTTRDRVFLVTGSTELFNVIENINYYANDVPVLSVTPSHVMANSNSVFMAIGVSFKTNAKLAADYAYRIITHQSDPQTLPVGLVSTPDIAINFQRKPPGDLKVPFKFFEDAFFIFNHDGVAVREDGKSISRGQ
ncbi:hypothetical protein A9Q99_07350 [Gammaproteobacteria bacterium 45_16_T64]|nr:hypothetical protein A9Q99_07350 [Gammaproteobacteria bacterium 45_16_T64]